MGAITQTAYCVHRRGVFELVMTELKKALSEIPHLRIPLQVDIKNLAAEVTQNVSTFSSIQINDTLAGDKAKEFSEAWRARGIIDYSPESTQIFTYQSMVKNSKENLKVFPYYKTELYYKLNQARRVIDQITQSPKICRLFLLKANKSLPWHRHSMNAENYNDYNTLIFQIPIVNSENSVYEVKHRETEEIFSQIYRPGEAWILNSFHFHRVTNKHNADRVSLFIETDIKNVTLDLKKIVQGLKNFTM